MSCLKLGHSSEWEERGEEGRIFDPLVSYECVEVAYTVLSIFSVLERHTASFRGLGTVFLTFEIEPHETVNRSICDREKIRGNASR